MAEKLPQPCAVRPSPFLLLTHRILLPWSERPDAHTHHTHSHKAQGDTEICVSS